ncbi:hypothetical protein AB0I35_10505 [Nocardia sp. NPDC050378]|uniref:hypothetical protein n=1 Tax=Nocardia sp. NPDC050378 TaxID=3155400 RepID=UPI00340111B0
MDKHNYEPTPEIRCEAAGFVSVTSTWNLDAALDAFLDELATATPQTGSSAWDVVVTAALADRSFPSIHFDSRFLNRLAATGVSLRIVTGPRATLEFD